MSFAKTYSIVFFLFGVSLLTSMAGMEIFSGLILLFSLFHFFKSPEKKKLFGKELLLFLLLIVTTVSSLIINQYYQEIPPTLGWFRWIIIFYGINFGLMQSAQHISYLLIGTMTGGTLSVLNSIIQSFTHRDWTRGNKVIDYYADITKQTTRVTGFFNMPTTYGYIIAMGSFVPIGLFFLSTTKKNKLIYGSLSCFFIFGLALTYSRGAWIGFVSGLFLILFFKRRKLVLPFILSILVAIVALFSFSSGFNERINSLSDPTYYSNSQRIELWVANLAIFKDHPVFGVGFNQNDYAVEEYHEKLGHTEKYRSHAHNIYLQYLAGTGLLGFLSLIIFLSYFFIKNLKEYISATGNKKMIFLTLLGIQFCFITSGFFDCNMGDSEVRYSFITFLAILRFISHSDFEYE